MTRPCLWSCDGAAARCIACGAVHICAQRVNAGGRCGSGRSSRGGPQPTPQRPHSCNQSTRPTIHSLITGELSSKTMQAGWACIMLCQRQPSKLRTSADFEHEQSERINVLRSGRSPQTAWTMCSETTRPLLNCQKSQKTQQALCELRRRVSVHNTKGCIYHKFHFLAPAVLCSNSACYPPQRRRIGCSSAAPVPPRRRCPLRFPLTTRTPYTTSRSLSNGLYLGQQRSKQLQAAHNGSLWLAMDGAVRQRLLGRGKGLGMLIDSMWKRMKH